MARTSQVCPEIESGPTPLRGRSQTLDQIWNRSSVSRSERTDVLRLRALRALGDVELDLLVLVQRLVAVGLDGRVVHEDVVAAVLLRNEAETLLGVEPLHGALSHVLGTPVIGNEKPSRRRLRIKCGDTSLRLTSWKGPKMETPLDHKLRGRQPAGTCTCCGINPTNKSPDVTGPGPPVGEQSTNGPAERAPGGP